MISKDVWDSQKKEFKQIKAKLLKMSIKDSQPEEEDKEPAFV